MRKLYANWGVHNIIAHPLMQILNFLGATRLATKVHDSTLPEI